MKTLGEKRVRVIFNPSLAGNVHAIKEKTAELINLLEDYRKDDGYEHTGEDHRVISEAQTNYEIAAMWAVKAVTSHLG